MGKLLRAGVLLAAMVVLMGGVLYLVRYGELAPNYHVFRGEPQDLRSVIGILTDVLNLRSRGIIQFGVLLLIATPVGRVLFAIYGFHRQRDWIFVAVTLLVASLLLVSLAGWSGA